MKLHCRQVSPEFQNVELGKGTEWIIHEGATEPDAPHEIQGRSIICYGTENYEIAVEIAIETGADPFDVCLWEYAGGFSEEFLNRNRRKQ